MNTDCPCSSEAVLWCYRIFLGRDPENAWVVEEKLQRLNTMTDICDEFVFSAEFVDVETVQRRKAVPATAEICSWAARLILGSKSSSMDLADLTQLESLDEVLKTLHRQTRVHRDRPAVTVDEPCKIALLGNCQTDSLRDLLQHCTRWQVVNWREHVLTDPAGQSRVRSELSRFDIILTQPLSVDRFGVLATSELIAADMRLVVIPNLYFAGLHPELVYIGPLGKRLQSPLGDYHSAVALAAFLTGLTPEDALPCFDDDALFEQAGLFDVWAFSWAEYLARESKCAVTMADYLDHRIRHYPLFYSVNHPVGRAMNELVRRIVRYLSGQDAAPQFIRDEFQNGVIYPVWGPIIRRQKLAYTSRSGFYLEKPMDFLPLPDYLRQAYAGYAKGLDGVELPQQVLRLREILSSRRSNHTSGVQPATDRETAAENGTSIDTPALPRRRWWSLGRS